MTEAEWLACDDPDPMLEFLHDRASERKVRLFGCACCRRIWHLMTHERCRTAVAVAERLADDRADEEEWERAQRGARGVRQTSTDLILLNAATAAVDVVSNIPGAADAAAWAAAWATTAQVGREPDPGPEHKAQTDLLRDIFGNPFRAVTIDPAWLRSNGGAVKKLAQSIYDERGFDRLPILADALEEAGCDDEAMLEHSRRPGEHVLGCWVADLILGRE